MFAAWNRHSPPDLLGTVGHTTQRRNIGGTIERTRLTHALGPITRRGKTPPADIIAEAERFMTTVNHCSIPVDQVITFVEFVEAVFLPSAKANNKPSTAKRYESLWRLYLKPLATSGKGTFIKDIHHDGLCA